MKKSVNKLIKLSLILEKMFYTVSLSP